MSGEQIPKHVIRHVAKTAIRNDDREVLWNLALQGHREILSEELEKAGWIKGGHVLDW
jgi:hypothetical protein